MRKITKRAAVIATTAVIAVGGGTAAFAYAAGWFHGDGTATASTSAIKNVNAVVTVSGPVYPGKVIAITNAQVANPNDYPVLVTGVTVASVTDPSGAGCDQSKAGFSFSEVPSTKVESGQTPGNVSLGKMTMSPDADPVCAGHTLTVNLTLAGEIANA
jgi:hypothetical protein